MPRRTIFSLQNDDRTIRAKGDVVLYYKGHKCSCGAADARRLSKAEKVELARDDGRIGHDPLRARLTCPICGGTGFWWDTPIKMKGMVLDVTSANSKELLAAGLAAPGDMTFLPPPLALRKLQLNDFDKFVFPHRGGQPYDGDVLVRGQFNEDYDLLKYPAATLDSVTWYDENETVPSVRRPEVDTDYSWAELNRRLTWLRSPEESEAVPPLGQRYSVTYHCYYEWIAFVSPYIRVEANNQLGPRVLLRKRHLVGMT